MVEAPPEIPVPIAPMAPFGASVALVARTEKDLKAVAGELPGPSLVLSGDVRDAAFNDAVADATVGEWGGVDVWICNAGISPIVAGPLETTPEVWRDKLAPLRGRVSQPALEAVEWALALDEKSRPQNVGEWRRVLEGGARGAVVLRPAAPAEIGRAHV